MATPQKMQASTSFSLLLSRCKPARKQTNCGGLTVLARGYADAKAAVPFELIKQLRLKTKAGLSDCKEALAASGNDPVKAEEWLRKRASVIAAKKSDRVAAEGLIAAVADKHRKRAVMVEVRRRFALPRLRLSVRLFRFAHKLELRTLISDSIKFYNHS